MSSLIDPLPEHQTVAVLGLGVTGRGAARLLHKLGKMVIATDSRELTNLDLPDEVELRLGGISVEGATAAVLSPSLNPEWPENQEKAELAPVWERWRAGDLEVVSEIVMAAAAYPGKVLSIGGTDGKSTTASLSAHLLNALGYPALLGGNSWTPLSQKLVDEADDLPPYAVIEVSAFQLWEPHGFAPAVALMTNIAPDHLDHYAGEADYVAAKKQVTRNLGSGSKCVFFAADRRLAGWTPQLEARGVECYGYTVGVHFPGRWRMFSEARRGSVRIGALEFEDPRHDVAQLDTSSFGLPGSHNRKNLAGSLLAVWALTGLTWSDEDATTLSDALGSFRGLPHRVELVRELDGVKYYNDSKATNVHAALAGLSAFDEPIVAIVGGVDKKLDLGPMIDLLETKSEHVVLIGELRERFTREAGDRLSLHTAESMAEAVARSRQLASPGQSVVLSPACSSFDMFRSFEHRGDVFAEIVQELE